MRLPCMQFTVRQMVVGVAILAVLAYNLGIPAWDRLRGPLMTRIVLTRLGRPIRLATVGPMPLLRFLESIQQASAGSIPLAIDAQGLNAVRANIGSQVAIDTDGIAIGRLLDRTLEPLGLSFYVLDGSLIITSISETNRVLGLTEQARRP
jgi:hypothetical protein